MDKCLLALLLLIPVLFVLQLETYWVHTIEVSSKSVIPPLSTEEMSKMSARMQEELVGQMRELLAEQEARFVALLEKQKTSHHLALQELQDAQSQAFNDALDSVKSSLKASMNQTFTGSSDSGSGKDMGSSVNKKEDPENAWHAILAAKDAAQVGGGLAGTGIDGASAFNGSEVATVIPATCGRQRDTGRLGYIEWRPARNRYLLALCTGGQMSNRLMCIRQNMLNAAVLNRTLILPAHELDYDYNTLVDFDHFKFCFGPKSLLTVEQFRNLSDSQGVLHVDKMLCHIHSWQPDSFCASLMKRLEKDLGTVFGPDVEIVRPPPRFSIKIAAFRKKFATSARVVAFGNMFGVGLKDAPLNSAGGGSLVTAPTCQALLQPSRSIMMTARGFANTFLGNSFAAVHLRRGDFFHHCLLGDAKDRLPPCFLPIKQVAGCLVKRLKLLEGLGAEQGMVVFLATDGSELEVQLLSSLVSGLHPGTALMQLPEKLDEQPWAHELVMQNLHNDPQVRAVLTKAICGLARFFFGSWTSTFSGDIHRLRDWWNSSSCADSGICQQQDPGDILPMATSTAQLAQS